MSKLKLLKNQSGFVNILVSIGVGLLISVATYAYTSDRKETQAGQERVETKLEKQEAIILNMTATDAKLAELLGRQEEKISNIKERVINLEKR